MLGSLLIYFWFILCIECLIYMDKLYKVADFAVPFFAFKESLMVYGC